MSSVISDRHFHDERAAYAYVEARIWPNGPTCPHCGNADAKRMKPDGRRNQPASASASATNAASPSPSRSGPSSSSRMSRCAFGCRRSTLLCSSKKGISANQLASHPRRHPENRLVHGAIAFARRSRDGAMSPIGGGEGQLVEIDETLHRSQGRRAETASARLAVTSNVVLEPWSSAAARSRSFHVDWDYHRRTETSHPRQRRP